MTIHCFPIIILNLFSNLNTPTSQIRTPKMRGGGGGGGGGGQTPSTGQLSRDILLIKMSRIGCGCRHGHGML